MNRQQKFQKSDLSTEEFVRLYQALLLPRLIEEKMILRLRQGKLSKWFSGIGQEAIAVGATAAIRNDEYILPMIRNLGVFTTRGIPLERLFSQWQGKANGFTHGRDRTVNFGTAEYRIIGMIAHLATQLSVGDGIALAHRLRREQSVVVAFTGDGATSEGEFHEALNLASVWQLPIIFLIESNGWALSTPTREQYRCASLLDRASGYGMEGMEIDGNDLLEVYHTVRALAESIRENPRPVLLVCQTYRMRGHEETSGMKYVPKEEVDAWAQKDPVARYEALLSERGLIAASQMLEIRQALEKRIDDALQVADAEPEIESNGERELADVYAKRHSIVTVTKGASKEMRFVDAVGDGLREALRAHSNLLIMGQDVAELGGVFKVTEGLVDEFGKERIRNTPLCEAAVVGAAHGLSIAGMKSVVEMQFADFVSCGFNQIVNNLAKAHYRWGQQIDVVVRLPAGGGVQAGPYHSQTMEAWFTHTPGLKVVYPAFPIDAKGLLLASIADPNPVIFFEQKALYRSQTEMVPEGYFEAPLGTAHVCTRGSDATIVTYGLGVHWALQHIEQHPGQSIEIVDLRTLVPCDWETIFQSVEKTGRAVVLYEASYTGAFGAEIAARISEACFSKLDAPVMRVGSLDTPIPFTRALEANYLASARLADALLHLLQY